MTESNRYNVDVRRFFLFRKSIAKNVTLDEAIRVAKPSFGVSTIFFTSTTVKKTYLGCSPLFIVCYLAGAGVLHYYNIYNMYVLGVYSLLPFGYLRYKSMKRGDQT